jgi:hypothetical protein
VNSEEPLLEREMNIATQELSREFGPDLPPVAVERAVKESFEGFEGSPIKTFVPILARRQARETLRRRIGADRR